MFRRERKARRAREDLKLERGRSVQSGVERWLPDAPHSRGQSRIAELVPIWTRPASRTSTTRSTARSMSQQQPDDCIRSHTLPLQRQLEQMRHREAQKDQTIAKLERDLEQHKSESAKLKAHFELALQQEKGLHHAEVEQLKQQFKAVLGNLKIQDRRCLQLQAECERLNLQQNERSQRIQTLEAEKAELQQQVNDFQRRFNNLQSNAAAQLRRANVVRDTKPPSSYQGPGLSQSNLSGNSGSSRRHRSSSGRSSITSQSSEDESRDRYAGRASSGSRDARDLSEGSRRRHRTYTVSHEQSAREDSSTRRTSSRRRRQQEHRRSSGNSRDDD